MTAAVGLSSARAGGRARRESRKPHASSRLPRRADRAPRSPPAGALCQHKRISPFSFRYCPRRRLIYGRPAAKRPRHPLRVQIVARLARAPRSELQTGALHARWTSRAGGRPGVPASAGSRPRRARAQRAAGPRQDGPRRPLTAVDESEPSGDCGAVGPDSSPAWAIYLLPPSLARLGHGGGLEPGLVDPGRGGAR